MNRKKFLTGLGAAALLPWRGNRGEEVVYRLKEPQLFNISFVDSKRPWLPWTLDEAFDEMWGEHEEGDRFGRIVFVTGGKVKWVLQIDCGIEGLAIPHLAYDVEYDQEWAISVMKIDWLLPLIDINDYGNDTQRISDLSDDTIKPILWAKLEPPHPYLA